MSSRNVVFERIKCCFEILDLLFHLELGVVILVEAWLGLENGQILGFFDLP